MVFNLTKTFACVILKCFEELWLKNKYLKTYYTLNFVENSLYKNLFRPNNESTPPRPLRTFP